MVPVEQGPPEIEIERRSRGDAYASSREADASEARSRQGARLIGLLLMIVSSIVALLLVFGAWMALRAL